MTPIAQAREQEHAPGFKRILLATDFSKASEQAQTYALAVARRYDSTVYLVHVVPPAPDEPIPLDPLPRELDRLRLQAEQCMADLIHRPELRQVQHRALLEHGAVWNVLSSVICSENIDLLVLGTHGSGGLTKLVLGSVTEQVLRLASCPVLTVGPHISPPVRDRADFHRILFATDLGPASAKALPYALSLAEDCQAELILLHVVPPMPVLDIGSMAYTGDEIADWQARAREESTKRLKDLIPNDTKLKAPECITVIDFLPEGILGTAKIHAADLIVMGVNPTLSARIAAHIPWTVIHEVVSEATCPVLTARS